MTLLARLFPSLLAGVFAAMWLTASPAAAQERQVAPAAMTSCLDLGWSIAETFVAPRDCDGAWNYAILVGAIRVCELEGNRGFADALGQVRAECDRHFRSKPSTILDNHQFFKD